MNDADQIKRIEMMETKERIVTGYKATDENISCRGYQFKVGEWHETTGELEMCSNGFHFCTQPSGPWIYYNNTSTRIWKIEAKEVLKTPNDPGASNKKVCRFIRLVEELIPNDNRGNTGNYNTGDYNTGYGNTGSRNTGYGNTGNCNTGYGNTGNCNTGNCNTGDYNTGSRNTGYGNTGSRNTGDYNTGNCNTGYGNTGNCNTGDYNTGNCNTGYGNTGDYNNGFFCQENPTVKCFDVETGLTHREFVTAYPEYYELCKALRHSKDIAFQKYANLPGITPEKLTLLHAKHQHALNK